MAFLGSPLVPPPIFSLERKGRNHQVPEETLPSADSPLIGFWLFFSLNSGAFVDS